MTVIVLCQFCKEMLESEDKLQEEELQSLTYDDLLSFSFQVAKGMEFLSSKNVSLTFWSWNFYFLLSHRDNTDTFLNFFFNTFFTKYFMSMSQTRVASLYFFLYLSA